MKILGIETSCDDTSVAVYDSNFGLIQCHTINQFKIHKNYGGIVPELAARFHLIYLNRLVKKIFLNLEYIGFNFFFKQKIDAIAYTAGPGLVGSLLIGSLFSRSLALSLNIPCIMINHIEGHLLSSMINMKNPIFPFISLLVSGGNTQLIYAESFGKYIILGKSLDDAVGNVFDYIGKYLNLSYPSAEHLSTLAQFGKSGKYFFPRPMINKDYLNFSFSGLKTYTKNIIDNSEKTFQNKADIAKSFEEAIVDTLVIKCKAAIKYTGINRLVVCGGVSANNLLRKKLTNLIYSSKGKIFFPDKQFCTDNAAMIAYVGYLRYKIFGYKCIYSDTIFSKWSIDQLH